MNGEAVRPKNPIYTAERYRITWTGGARPAGPAGPMAKLFNGLLPGEPREFDREHLFPSTQLRRGYGPQILLDLEARDIATLITDPRLKVEAWVNGRWVAASLTGGLQAVDNVSRQAQATMAKEDETPKEKANRLAKEGYTQLQIAQRIGNSDRTLRRWFNGK